MHTTHRTDAQIHTLLECAAEDFVDRVAHLAGQLDDVHDIGRTFDQTIGRVRRSAHAEVTRLYNSREPRG
ncbi:hypothetical protein PQI66_09990 [Corynebacterium sp. USCH3]|uniref:hypothetical protein n=1 Tax=Corynebacterium sp. USCH3 TaxID=3024840 RepID=UPI0030A8B18A